MITLYNESHHIPTGGFIYDFYSCVINIYIYRGYIMGGFVYDFYP